MFSCSVHGGNENSLLLIKTTEGDIKIRLYDDTPIHRNNFIHLASTGLYDNVIFHRVINNFMIQSGDPSTKSTKIASLDTLSRFTIPSEFVATHFHKRGALAAARLGNEENPDLRSSGTQFYIVQGVKQTNSDLDEAEQKINNNIKQSVFNKVIHHVTDSLRSTGKNPTDSEIQEAASEKILNILTSLKPYRISAEQRETYINSGGVPRLDATYTVFGEVIEGMDIVDKIASTPTDRNDKPITEIRILKIKIFKN